MSASAEIALHSALDAAHGARNSLRAAAANERNATVRFMDEALHNGWSWARVGDALGISATGARRYYERNRRRVRGL